MHEPLPINSLPSYPFPAKSLYTVVQKRRGPTATLLSPDTSKNRQGIDGGKQTTETQTSNPYTSLPIKKYHLVSFEIPRKFRFFVAE